MARGHPDDFGFSMFPSYGVYDQEYYADFIADNAAHTIISIAAKGKIIGGWVFGSCLTAAMGNDLVNVKIDEVIPPTISVQEMIDSGFERCPEMPISLLCYDANPTYSKIGVLIRGDITFSQTFLLSIRGNTVDSRYWRSSLYWYQVV